VIARSIRSPRRDGDDRGSVAVVVAVSFLPIVAVLALVVDLGIVLTRRQELQAGVESAALAGAARWASGGGACTQAVSLLDANVDTTAPIDVQCHTTGSASAGRVTIEAAVDQPLPLGAILGRSSARVAAATGVVLGSPLALSGLRPLALCAEHPALAAWTSSGFTSTQVHRVLIQSSGTTCGGDVPGNWAMIDLDSGSNSNSELQDRVLHGYRGSVTVPSTLPGDPGIPTPAIQLGAIIGMPVTLPVFADARLAGGISQFDIVDFVGVTITAVNMTGAAADRYVDIRFRRLQAGEGPTRPGGGYGATSWQMCSLDEVTRC